MFYCALSHGHVSMRDHPRLWRHVRSREFVERERWGPKLLRCSSLKPVARVRTKLIELAYICTTRLEGRVLQCGASENERV